MVSGCRFVPLRYNFSLGVQLSGASPIGIGTPITKRPSHTTQHTGPYCAVRLINLRDVP